MPKPNPNTPFSMVMAAYDPGPMHGLAEPVIPAARRMRQRIPIPMEGRAWVLLLTLALDGETTLEIPRMDMDWEGRSELDLEALAHPGATKATPIPVAGP